MVVECSSSSRSLDGESFDLVTKRLDLSVQFALFVRVDAGSDHRSAHTASTTKLGLGGDVDIGNAFIFAVHSVSWVKLDEVPGIKPTTTREYGAE